MKKFTFFFLAFLFYSTFLFSQTITDEYGLTNFNRYLSGLGISASYVNVANQPVFNQNVNGTLEMWIYPTSYTGTPKTLISKGASTNVSFLWGLSASTGLMYLRIGTVDFPNNAGTAPPLNQWSHVAVTWMGGPMFTIKFYLNGAQTGTNVSGSAVWNAGSDAIRIGGSQAYLNNAFIGNIDEVRFWSIEVPASKIAANRFCGIADYINCNSSGQITTNSYYTGLISSWTFNTTGMAYDYAGNFNGTYLGSATSVVQQTSAPIPYNFAIKLGGGSSDYLVVPSNTNFNQSSDGTIELWYKPISFSTEQVLISKGATAASTSFIFGVAASTGKLYFGSGNSIALNTSGAGLTLNQWNHIAVTWVTSGVNFFVNFYKNGKLNGNTSSITKNFPANNDNVYIGNSQVYNLPAKGWIDELRIWHPALTAAQIKTYMFVSSRSFSSTNLLFAWPFDGNLLNFSSTTPNVSASFNSGSTNACRFSGFANDDASGAYGLAFMSHISVLNRTGSPNPFPNGFTINNPGVTIPDNNPTGVSDSIIIGGMPGTLNSIEVFLSVEHTWVGDLTISLKAPNGQTRNLVQNNGGSGDNILSFFNDNFTYLPSSSVYLPPWTNVRPITPFNQFGGTPINGSWTLKCVDNGFSDIGYLKGWGIRFNNLVSVEPVNGNVPARFSLYQNYPNPFNPVTNIKFDLPKDEFVKIILYDILGREAAPVINEFKKAGTYEVKFDGSNLSSGTYFYRIEAGDFVDTKKMILVK
jgi:subtilisin-like proprotein convertase family protein